MGGTQCVAVSTMWGPIMFPVHFSVARMLSLQTTTTTPDGMQNVQMTVCMPGGLLLLHDIASLPANMQGNAVMAGSQRAVHLMHTSQVVHRCNGVAVAFSVHKLPQRPYAAGRHTRGVHEHPNKVRAVSPTHPLSQNMLMSTVAALMPLKGGPDTAWRKPLAGHVAAVRTPARVCASCLLPALATGIIFTTVPAGGLQRFGERSVLALSGSPCGGLGTGILQEVPQQYCCGADTHSGRYTQAADDLSVDGDCTV